MKFIGCLTAWFQVKKTLQLLLRITLISQKQLDNFYKNEKKASLTESHRPQLGNPLQSESFRQKLPVKVVEAELN